MYNYLNQIFIIYAKRRRITCICKISRVTNILSAMMNGAIHSETAFHESRDSFHSHCDKIAVKKKDRTMVDVFVFRFQAKPSRKKCRRPIFINSRWRTWAVNESSRKTSLSLPHSLRLRSTHTHTHTHTFFSFLFFARLPRIFFLRAAARPARFRPPFSYSPIAFLLPRFLICRVHFSPSFNARRK